MAKKQMTPARSRFIGTALSRRQRADKTGPVAKLIAGTLDAELLATTGVSMRACAVVCETVIKSAIEAAPVVRDIDTAIDLAAQLARGAENYVQGSHNPDAGKWAFCSKPKLNELKKALREVGVKI